MAALASGPIWPNARAASWRSELFASLRSASIKAGTAALAPGPILPSARTASQRAASSLRPRSGPNGALGGGTDPPQFLRCHVPAVGTCPSAFLRRRKRLASQFDPWRLSSDSAIAAESRKPQYSVDSPFPIEKGPRPCGRAELSQCVGGMAPGNAVLEQLCQRDGDVRRRAADVSKTQGGARPPRGRVFILVAVPKGRSSAILATAFTASLASGESGLIRTQAFGRAHTLPSRSCR